MDTGKVRRPYFEAGIDGLQPFLVSFGLSLVALSTLSTVGRVVIGSRRGEGWTGMVLNVVATLLAIAHMVMLIYACHFGLGKHESAQQTDTHDKQMQRRYTMQLLAIAAIVCAKGSAASIIYQVAGNVHRRVRCSLLISMSIFAPIAIFGLAFQCSDNAPEFWNYAPQTCRGGSLEYVVLALNIATDIWLATVALPIIWRLQCAKITRLRLMFLLGARILVVLAECARLVSLVMFLNSRVNQSWNAAIIACFMTVTMELSILCANLPVLSSWMNQLISGHNGIHVSAEETVVYSRHVSRRSRNSTNKARPHSMPPVRSVPTPLSPPGDDVSDHGSQTGILKTTAVVLEHSNTDELTPDPYGTMHAQAQRGWRSGSG